MAELQRRRTVSDSDAARKAWSWVLMVATAAVWVAGCSSSRAQRAGHEGSEGGMVIRNLARPGSAEIFNGGTEVVLRTAVDVERRTASGWSKEVTDFKLTDDCSKLVGATVRMPANSTLRLVPWNGKDCASQCPAGCRASIYLGPGEFRFVVHAAEGGRRFEGPGFHMPGPGAG